MATTFATGPGEAVTITPTMAAVSGGAPEPRVQLLLRKGVIVIDRTLTVGDAYRMGMALVAAAEKGRP